MPRKTIPRVVRFMKKVEKDPNSECWIWKGSNSTKFKNGKNGYGAFETNTAHRAAYELLIGPIPEGFEVDHLCKNTLCVNPAHLEAVTPLENWRRSDSPTRMKSKQTECINGHSFDHAYIWTDKKGHVHRLCRICRSGPKNKAIWAARKETRKRSAEYWREYRAKRKAEGRHL